MARIKATAVPPDVLASYELPPASPDFRPLESRSTSGSWLVSFARRGSAGTPEYWLKVRKAKPLLPTSRKTDEQLTPHLEYRTARALGEYFANFPEFADSIPRPVQYLEDCKGIVTEYRQGRHLKDVLFSRGNVLRSAVHPGSLNHISAACGRWLRLLHEMTPPEWLPAHPADGSSLSRRARNAAYTLRPEVLRHLPLATLLDWTEELRPDGHHMAVSHGDFQPGNVLVSGSRISVIDVVAAGIRPVEDDISFFITFAFTHKQRVAFGNAAGTRGSVRAVCDAFLGGYGFKRSPEAMAGLRPHVAWLIVQRLADMNARIERWPRVPRQLLRARLVSWVRSELPLFLQEFERES